MTMEFVELQMNGWFKSCLSNYNQYVPKNVYDSRLTAINCDLHRVSVLGPLLFLSYANNLT